MLETILLAARGEAAPALFDLDGGPAGAGSAVEELTLLLPAGQAVALEAAAHAAGLTTGQLVRRLLSEFLGQTGVAPAPARDGQPRPIRRPRPRG